MKYYLEEVIAFMFQIEDKRRYLRFFNIVICMALFLWSYDATITSYNTTLLAFSYKYGFISRGLVGSVYRILQHITPFDMMDYIWALRFYQGVTAVVFLVFLLLINTIIKKIREEYLSTAEALIIFYSIFFIPMFANKNNFGRVDIFLVSASIIGAYFIVKDKLVFLVPVLAALAMMVHQGYVFMYFNILLVLLFARWMDKKEARYAVNFFVTFITGSALFLYFEFFSRSNGDKFVPEIVKNARLLTRRQNYHVTLIDHEILGLNLDTPEVSFHLENAVQLPMFLIMFLPFIILLFKILRGMFAELSGKDGSAAGSSASRVDITQVLKYLAISAGALTLLPNFLLKVDFGRWMFALISYYCITFAALFFMDDRAPAAIKNVFDGVLKRWRLLPAILLCYSLIFTPLLDVYLTQWTKDVSDRIGQGFYEKHRVKEDEFFVADGVEFGDDVPKFYVRYDILLQGGHELSELNGITFEDLVPIAKDVYDVTGYSLIAVQGSSADFYDIMLRSSSEDDADLTTEDHVYALKVYQDLLDVHGIKVTGKDFTEKYGEALRNGFAAGTINTDKVKDEIYMQTEDAGLWAVIPAPTLHKGDNALASVNPSSDSKTGKDLLYAKLFMLKAVKDGKDPKWAAEAAEAML